MGTEGSGKQISGLRNTKRMRGSHAWARRHKDLKPDSHPEGVEVDATGIWDEGGCAIHGEICSSAGGLISLRGGVMDGHKSAEGIIAGCIAVKARTCKAKRCQSLRRRRRRRQDG